MQLNLRDILGSLLNWNHEKSIWLANTISEIIYAYNHFNKCC